MVLGLRRLLGMFQNLFSGKGLRSSFGESSLNVTRTKNPVPTVTGRAHQSSVALRSAGLQS